MFHARKEFSWNSRYLLEKKYRLAISVRANFNISFYFYRNFIRKSFNKSFSIVVKIFIIKTSNNQNKFENYIMR